ncbi:cytochrome P450 [Mycena sanguinolenta]|nr:cytochrome P450 [Mycena sanguinolenta]
MSRCAGHHLHRLSSALIAHACTTYTWPEVSIVDLWYYLPSTIVLLFRSVPNVGNLPELLLSREYGEHEFQWQERYGQENRLMISDPKAIKYILNCGLFVFGPSQEKTANTLFGYGNVFIAHGEKHRHLRTLMNPTFSSKNVRMLLPTLIEIGRKLGDRWEALSVPGNIVDISPSLNDAALDAMGDGDSSLPSSGDLRIFFQRGRRAEESVSNPTKFMQVLDAALAFIPDRVFRLICDLPLPGMRMLQEYKKLTNALSFHLIGETRGSGLSTSFLGRLDHGVPDEEVGVHLRTLLIAGQETMGSTLSWALYKLAQIKDFQSELRQEIQKERAKGQPDFDNMPLLNALINEALRMYPAFPLSERIATEDCILPLSHPITTTTGVQISEIPINKGQRLHIAIGSYHRLPSIWGSDAGEFKPSRWLEQVPCKGPALGPHASLVVELQVFLAELVSRFALSLPKDDSVRPRVSTTLVPETSDGARQMPVYIDNIVA